jgi:hypothetical protein
MDGIGKVMSGAWFPSDVTVGIQAKSSILVSSDQRILFRCLLGKLQADCHVPFLLRSGFCLATLPSRPDWWRAVEMVVFLEGSPIST